MHYDVAVIGAGPGGYEAAIRCGQLGLNTVCIDQWFNDDHKPALGGTCLNVGCIPSKAVLDSSENYYRTRHKLHDHGISVDGLTIDIREMQARKTRIVKSLTAGIEALFLKNKVAWIAGHGKFVDTHSLEVVKHDGQKLALTADHIIIATGSQPAIHDKAKVDDDCIVDSTGALAFQAVPKSLAVLGGGVVGLELGSVWHRLGAKVHIFNRGDRFLSRADEDIAKQAFRLLQAQGLEIKLGAQLEKVNHGKTQLKLQYRDGGGDHSIGVEKLLVAIGRQPYTEGLECHVAGIELDDKGFIKTDAYCRAGHGHLFAIGDCTRGPMLAHRASVEGIAVAERIAGFAPHVNYQGIPWVIYTWPEIAWAGKTEQELQRDGIRYKVGQFPFLANGRAKAMGEPEGLIKIIADEKFDTVLGVHMIGPNVSELISEAVVAMEFQASAEDLARTVHAHPTLSEAVHEAALAVGGRAIHI